MSDEQNNLVTSNDFEKDPHDKRNDLIDSGVGFIVTFGFFMTIFVIFILFEVIQGL